MTNDDDDATRNRLEDAIVAELGVGVTGWLVFATYLDPDDATPLYYGLTMRGQTAFTTLGMLEGAAAIERDNIVAHNHRQDDDEDLDE